MEVLGWLAASALLGLSWQAVHELWPSLAPSPLEALEYLASLEPGLVARSLVETLAGSSAGFVVGLVFSLSLVSLAYAVPRLAPTVNALATILQSVSALVWVFVFIVLFGVTSRLPPVLVSAAVSAPILLSGLMGGISVLDRRYSELARLLGASRLQELRHIVLPGLVPFLASSGRSAYGVALRISVVAEALGGSGGVGYMLMLSYDRGDFTGVFAWGLLLVLLMIAVDQALLRPLEAWARRWLS